MTRSLTRVVRAAIPRPIRRFVRAAVDGADLDGPADRSRLDVRHLQHHPEEDALGPVQQSEALLLYAMARVCRPRVVVEFGFHNGDSARNFLAALAGGSVLHSYDVAEEARARAADLARSHPNFHFHHKSQADFTRADVGAEPVDLVFFDASHDLALNQATWNAVSPALRDRALVVVHDTGTWHRRHFLPVHEELVRTGDGRWLDGNEYQHRVEEREFVNWLVQAHDDVSAVHFHSTNTLRHGLTVLQRRPILETGETAR
jgi:predicted O-methyltransferase YrrM